MSFIILHKLNVYYLINSQVKKKTRSLKPRCRFLHLPFPHRSKYKGAHHVIMTSD